MAKVTDPLFSDFREALGDCLVFQRNTFGDVIARLKVVPAADPRSPHSPGRIAKWAEAIEQHQNDEAPNADLESYVERYAIPPNHPTNLIFTSITPHPTDPDLVEFDAEWEAPTHKYYGHDLENLAGYFIEVTSDYVTWTRLNTDPIPNAQYSGNAPADTSHAVVYAVDDQGNVSTSSPVVEFVETPTENALPNPPTNLTRSGLCTYSTTPYMWSYQLNWTAPTQREDGSPLENLAGYIIYIAYSPGNYSQYNTELITNTQEIIITAGGNHAVVVIAVDEDELQSSHSDPETVNSLRPPAPC